MRRRDLLFGVVPASIASITLGKGLKEDDEFFSGKVKTRKCTSWFKDGVPHKTDGPAVEWLDGWKEWWFNGEYYGGDGPGVKNDKFTQDEFLKMISVHFNNA